MEKSQLSLLKYLPIIGIVGCDIGPKDQISSSGGLVNKGILSNAIANAYRADTKELVKTVYTQIDGTFSLDDINFQGSLFVEVKTTSQTLATCDGATGCGDYPNGLKQAGEFDKNLNGRIDFGDKYFFHDQDFILTAYIKPLGNESSSGKFAVTPLTHLAAEKISQFPVSSAEEIELVNAQVAELFGLNGTDITRVIPPDITNEEAMLNADKSQQLYAALNAAVASAATTRNTTVSDVINTLATSFKENNGLVGNSSDSTKLTLASLQTLAKDVATVVESTLNVSLADIKDKIQDEITEQLAKPADEIVEVTTSPVLVPDFDKDGIGDEDEVNIYQTDPFNPDTDDDGLLDGLEIQYGTDPKNTDTDGDGLPDGWEVFVTHHSGSTGSLDPLTKDDQLDPDADGLSNLQEFQAKTNPFNSDTDSDGLNDFDEINTHGTNPGHSDTDGDGLKDGDELSLTTNPLDFDTDNDGMPDGWEVQFGTAPLSPDNDGDSDGDSLINYHEYLLGTDPNTANTGELSATGDIDGDGINNIDELNLGLDPFFNDAHLDADGDGISNIVEIQKGGNVFIPNPIIKFVSDAQIYTNSTTGSLSFAISADENFIVASQTDVSDLNIAGIDIGNKKDILIHNLASNTYELPVRADGLPSVLLDGDSDFLDLSNDGLSILFSTVSSNAVAGDFNSAGDLFIYNRVDKSTRRLGTDVELNGSSMGGQFAGDDKKIVMTTNANNFAPTDNNSTGDMYLYEVASIPASDTASLISQNYLASDSANGNTLGGDISNDGQRIIIGSYANDIVDAGITDVDSLIDTYIFEAPNNYKRITLSVDSAEDDTAADAGWGYLSKNGKAVVYETPRDILDYNFAGVGAGYNQIFYADVDKVLAGDTTAQHTTLITASYDGSNNGYATGHAIGSSLKITGDGQTLFYASEGTTLVDYGDNSASIPDLFVWDKFTQKNHRLSQFVYGEAADGTLTFTTSYGNGMGIGSYQINADGTHIYALLDNGHQFTNAPAGCANASTYCLYKISIPRFIPDQDNDGLNDAVEETLFTIVNNPDTDSDGLLDGQEVYQFKTSPIKPDTDGDSVNDGQETQNGTDPLDPLDF